ncbi:MAG: NADH-quinone oxidoreductase subunit N [Pseudonocardiales bacterium]
MSQLQRIDYAAVAPLLVVSGAAVAVLVADLFLPLGRRMLAVWLALAGVLGALAVAVVVSGSPRRTFCIAGTTLPGGIRTGASCSYVIDHFTMLLTVICCVAAAVCLLLSVAPVAGDRLPAGESAFLVLCSLAGMITIAGARDLITIVVALEVLTLPVYVLAGLHRDDPRSAEAALKFFLVSVLSGAVTLFGVSLVYGLTGAVHLDRVAAALAQRHELRQMSLTAAAVLLVVVGFAFKVSAVPFHWWAPDTYQGAPVHIAAFLATASKAAGFAGLLLVLLVGFRPYADVWGPVLAVLAIATMTLGNVVALRQRHMVRLLAWSSVAQAGYLLLPLGVAAGSAGRSDGDLRTSAAATLAFLGLYVAMSLGAFACVAWVSRGSPGNAVEDYRGLVRRSPVVAVALAFFVISLAGLPPGFAGLFAKVVVFRSALVGGAGVLALVMAVNTVIGLAYYIRVAALLFARPAGTSDPQPDVYRRGLAGAAAIAVTAVLTVVLGFAPQLIFSAGDFARLP